MIPKNLTHQTILDAIKEADKDGIPSDRQSTKWDVLYENKKYPPQIFNFSCQPISKRG